MNDRFPSSLVTVSAHGGTVIVRPTSTPNQFTKGWFGYGDRPVAVGSASITTRPATQVLGIGSLEMVNTSGLGGWEVAAYTDPAVPAGTPLADITSLSYASYRPASDDDLLHSTLQFTIDYDLSDPYTGFQGRLVYEPYHCNATPAEVWSFWNTLEAGNGMGCWWQTANPANPARAPYVNGEQQSSLACPQSNPCTWAEVRTAYPNAGFHPTNSATGLIFKVGSPWTGTFFVDALVVGLTGTSTTYDFEPNPATKDDCKHGGWAGYGFKSQGQCIRFVNTSEDGREE